MEDVSLLIMSCDKYSSAWYPYFELLKKYWPEHPKKVYLSSETRSYDTEGIEIININGGKVEPWSQRLINVLNTIDTEYIIFSLEDFFLLGKVNQGRIEECLQWMREDPTIAECRLSTFETIHEGDVYNNEFRVCPQSHKYRIDTQFAIWRKSYLLSILNIIETPWQFEVRASDRSRCTPEKLLWFSPQNNQDLETMIIPYYNDWTDGYGIGWGKWRPKNREWFEKNGIYGVKYRLLGSLSEKDIDRRKEYLYTNPTTAFRKSIKAIFQIYVYADRVLREFLITGFHRGIKNTFSILKSKNS
ncbi:MAG: hypothetical protein NC453_12020 [Muribaculum sp.]|nr:hypothetical protein [Muribaculum sp.]